jgi:hypothetical protein
LKGIAVNGMRILTVVVVLCFGLLSGCDKTAPRPRFAGLVVSHVDTYRSGTGPSSDLVREKNMDGGFHYGDVKKTDWKSEIHWELIGYHGESDVYRFKRVFRPVGGAALSSEMKVEYDGKKPVIVFQNDSETVSIELGSIPLPENSQQPTRSNSGRRTDAPSGTSQE